MKRKLFLFCFLFIMSVVYAQKVYVTKSGKKYHEYSCRYVSSTAFNLKLEDAVLHGYSPCSVCKPVQAASQSTSVNSFYSSSSTSSSRSSSVQCSGTTKKGSSCKHMTTNSSGYCYQHGGR